MKRPLAIVLALLLVMGLTGCEAVQRKFTRKKKREPVRPVFYEEGMGAQTRPNIELYMMHYTYWKTWHDELIEEAGVNAKRDRLASGEVISNLTDMRKRLVDEKAGELQGYIDQTAKITAELTRGKATTMRLGYLKQRLDKIGTRIARHFYYKKVREYIKPDKQGG